MGRASGLKLRLSLAKWFAPYVLVNSLQYSFAKDSLSYGSPFVIMAMRYLIAASILLLISRRVLLNRDVLVTAALTATSTALWILGLEYVTSGDSAVLSFSMPLFAILIATLTLKERPSRWEILGCGIGFTGVILYSTTLVHGTLLLGAVLTLSNAIFWGAFTVAMRKMRNEEPFSVVGSQFLIGSLPLVVGAFIFPEVHFVGPFVIDILYMAILGGVIQFTLWQMMLKVERVAKVTSMIFAVPAFAVLIDALETSTFPKLLAILGASIMFLGVYISSRGELQRETAHQAQI